jgi:hypothetical protein
MRSANRSASGPARWRCSVASSFASVDRFVGVLHEHQRAERFERWPRQIAALERGELLLEFRRYCVDQRRVPSNQNRRAGRMLGLGDEICRGEIGPRRLVGDDDHLARPGD